MAQKTNASYDVIVVGSGASGGWAAKRLAEAGVNVALVEAGRAHTSADFREHRRAFQLPYHNLARDLLRRTRPRQTECYACTEHNADWFANDLEEPYNTLDDKYARVITEELLPVLYKEYHISKDPDMHGIGGSSSGAIAAFTVAWERPNHFRKVLSNVGSFVNLRGGHVYPETVLASERKPLRVYLCDGRNDNRGLRNGVYDEQRDWFYQNVRLMKALTQKGYDVNYSWSMNLHGKKYGGMIMPEMMRWLWRDGPVSTDVNDMVERSFRQPAAKPH